MTKVNRPARRYVAREKHVCVTYVCIFVSGLRNVKHIIYLGEFLDQ